MHTTDSPARSSAPPHPAIAPAPTPKPTKNPRGNPNLALAPRCGARTRAGCPCRAPAIRGKQRCRMHGGRSTGPRTAAGLARLRAAHTTHGRYAAETRTRDRHFLTHLRRSRVALDAVRYRAWLPPELVARLDRFPPELSPPPWPTGALSRAEDRALVHAEAAALAPWRHAIAAARQARRQAAQARSAAATAPGRPAAPHAPELPPASGHASREAAATPRAPEASSPRRPRGPAAAPAAGATGVARHPTGAIQAARPATPHAPESPPAAGCTSHEAATTPHAPVSQAPPVRPHPDSTRHRLLAGTCLAVRAWRPPAMASAARRPATPTAGRLAGSAPVAPG